MPKRASKSQGLHEAVRRRQIDRVTSLLDGGADVDAVDPQTGLTPLSLAISADDPRIVRLLLERGARLDTSDGGYLWEAMSGHSPKTFKLLLEFGADPNDFRGGGERPPDPPLFAAVETGWDEWVKALLAAGADPNRTNGNGLTPLEWAVKCRFLGMVALLENVTAPEARARAFKPPDIDPRLAREDQLIRAAREGDVAGVKRLLADGVDVDGTGSADGRTALSDAAAAARRDVVRVLLAAGAAPHGKNGWLPLPQAARTGDVEVIAMLLDAGADIRAGNGVFGPPLVEAASHGWFDAVSLLLQRGADPAQRDEAGRCPLDGARRCLWPDYIQHPRAAEVRRTIELLESVTPPGTARTPPT